MDKIKNFLKDISRHNKYIFLFLFIFLASMVFYSLTTSGQLMRNTGESYLDRYDIEDIKLVSSHGIGQEDLDLITETLDSSSINVGYQMDVGIENTSYLLSVESLPESWVKFDLKRGRLPEQSGEIAVDDDLEDFPYEIGDTIKLSQKGDNPMMRLKEDTYTIVGEISSPKYILKSEKGRSNLTGSSLDGYALIMPQDFDLNKPNFARIHLKATEDLSYFSDQYKAIVDNESFKLAEAFAPMPEKKIEIVKEEAEARINESTAKIKDLEAERIARSEEISQEKENFEKERQEYQSRKKEYDDRLAKSQDLLDNGQDQLKKASQDLKLLEKNQAELQKQYDEQAAKLDQIYNEYLPIKNEYESIQASIDERQANIDAEYDYANNRLAEISSQIGDLRRDLADARSEIFGIFQVQSLENSIEALENERDALEDRLRDLSSLQAEVDADYSRLASLEADYNSLQSQYESASSTLAEYEKSLEEINSDIEAKKAERDQLEEDIAEAENFMNRDQKPMEEDLANTKEGLDSKEGELAEKVQEYDTFMEDSEKEINSLKAIRQRSEEEQKGNVKPTYDIEATSDNEGMNLYSSITNRVDMMTSIFPLVLLALAVFTSGALCYSIMNEGPSNNSFTPTDLDMSDRKRLIKLAVACLLGLVLGIIAATVLSLAIFNLYGESFIFDRPSFEVFPAQVLILLVSFALAFIVSFIVSYFNISFDFNVASSRPAINNLINHPMRLVGNILSLALSLALIFIGLSLSRSISNISDMQYRNIVNYHVEIGIAEGIKSEDMGDFDFFLTEVKNARDLRDIVEYKASTQIDGSVSVDFDLIIPNRIEDFGQQMNLIDSNGSRLEIPEEGIIISKKISEVNGLKAGDIIGFTIGESMRYEAEIKGIFDNYVSDFAYMSPSFYEETTGQAPNYNQKNVVLVDSSAYAIENFVNDASKYEEVQNINTVINAKDDVDDIIRPLTFISLLYVVIGIIVLFVNLILQIYMVTDKRLREIGSLDGKHLSTILIHHFIGLVLALIIGLGLGTFLFNVMTSMTVNDNIRIVSQVYWLDYAIIIIGSLVIVSFLYVYKSSQYSIEEE